MDDTRPKSSRTKHIGTVGHRKEQRPSGDEAVGGVSPVMELWPVRAAAPRASPRQTGLIMDRLARSLVVDFIVCSNSAAAQGWSLLQQRLSGLYITPNYVTGVTISFQQRPPSGIRTRIQWNCSFPLFERDSSERSTRQCSAPSYRVKLSFLWTPASSVCALLVISVRRWMGTVFCHWADDCGRTAWSAAPIFTHTASTTDCTSLTARNEQPFNFVLRRECKLEIQLYWPFLSVLPFLRARLCPVICIWPIDGSLTTLRIRNELSVVLKWVRLRIWLDYTLFG